MDDRYAIIGVQTPKYNLLRYMMGDIEYDRIGIIINDIVTLYWVIPSSNDPWIGDIMNLPVKMAKICIYNIKTISKLPELPIHDKTLINDQFFNGYSDGIITFNKILESITNREETNHYNISLSRYKELGQPRIVNIDFTNECPSIVEHNDLLELLMEYPKVPIQIIHNRRVTIFTELISMFDRLILELTSSNTVLIELLTECINKIDECRIKYNIEGGTLSTRVNKIKRDRVIVLEVDGTLISHIKNVHNIITKMSDAKEETPIHMGEFIDNMNMIFQVFKFDKIVMKHIPYSKLLVYDNTRVKLRLDDMKFGLIEIPITGEGLDIYGKDDLKHILEAIDVVECSDARFIELKSLIMDKITNTKR